MTQLHRRFDFLSKRARRGVSLLWIIIAFPALVLFLVFAVEIGNIWLARVELEQSLEANALAAVKQWAESGGGDTLDAREVGNAFSIANPVRRQDVDLTDMTLNTAFSNGPDRLNYDNSGMSPNPNQNLVCSDISDYNSYLQPGVMVFGAIVQTEDMGNPAESVIFNADVEPSCFGGGADSPLIVMDVTAQGNLGAGNSDGNEWGVSLTTSSDQDINSSFRIYRIEIDVSPDNFEFEFLPSSTDIGKITDNISEIIDGQQDNFFVGGHLNPNTDVVFSGADGGTVLTIDFLQDGLAPGDRFRFAARVLDGNSVVGGDDIGRTIPTPGQNGTIVRIYASNDGDDLGLILDSYYTDFDEPSNSCVGNPPATQDDLGNDHYIVHPSGIQDLPCPAASGNNNNGQSYIAESIGPGGALFAVRAQATIGVQSVVQSICGFNLGPWGVSAKATAYYDCETNDPKLIRVDVFQCDPPMN
ncbi:TadE/TadG family type IV pilus assembly protein [Bremerella alba]|uniref:Uncharacterized protein n=1 Tax=Bremerella alba TaxID=980252 RepID=A0A7V8VB29_9BACT|nr:hypothetical protein [Bremerella alba]MBA2117896.1 hypothetical protein [Bremerella alba]